MQTNFLTMVRAFAIAMTAGGLVSCASPSSPKCPTAQDLTADMLQGEWMAQVIGQRTLWVMSLRAHPTHAGSLSGTLQQGTQRIAVVADLDDGEFTLEETRDGQRISATWQGTPVEGACGRLLRGQRTEGEGSAQAFTLTRQVLP